MTVVANGQAMDTNWLEIVGSELRAWWEVLQQPSPRTPEPIVVYAPSRSSQSSMLAGDQGTWLVVGLVVLGVILLNQSSA